MRARRLAAAIALPLALSGLAPVAVNAAPIAYVSAGNVSPTLYTADLGTRLVTPIGAITGLNPVEALAIAGSKKLYAVGGSPTPKLVEIDKADAHGETVLDLAALDGADATLSGLAFGPEESLWLAADKYTENAGEPEIEADLMHLDVETKSIDSSGRAGGTATALEALAGGCDGTMYAATWESERQLARIALPGAALTSIGPITGPGENEDFDMAFDHSAKTLYGLSESGALYRIDPSTGAATSLGSLMHGSTALGEIHGFTIDSPSACPPPEEMRGEERKKGEEKLVGGPELRPAPRCVVPKLKGKTLKKAKSALRAADCGVGKVRGPKRRPGATPLPLIVASSSPPAGTSLPAGSSVKLKLVPKPASRR